MIYVYGISEPGTYHIKNNIVCQDYYKIVHSDSEMVIAAVADGLGSSDHSDIASKIAVEVATKHCHENVNADNTTEEIIDVIKASFVVALQAIEQEVKEQERSLEQYDTTLTLAILIRDTLYYGHSGDSGIIALTIEGRYEAVTTQQRDGESRVFPLFFEDKWVFAQFDRKVSSVFLATDGMLETLFPIYIRSEPVNIYVALARFFMDNSSLQIDEVGQEAVQNRIREFIKNIPDEQVNDDKTIVVLVNPSVACDKQPDNYYSEPDWVALKAKHADEYRKKAYPHLFTESPDTRVEDARNEAHNTGEETK